MKLLKPDWVNHNGMPICSIDIHPDGSRVATGGQGEDSGRIVIWNMAPIIYGEKEMDENVPRMLCQLDNHLACVNCVRWSSSGKYLASGGDDKLVMVWTISKSSSGNSVFGGKGKVNLEGWRCVWTLRNHQGDVLDMAWSPNDLWLATCSVDNTVIVWRADNLPEVVTVLKGHTGLVKGVSWDPVGKYLSSQSDDKSVRIWRTGDWHQEAVIKQPFENCSGTTLVLRLSWSPDGQYLVTAHAMNGSVPTAQIIDRDGWSHETDFVGHHMAVTCVRFSGFIMESERKGKVGRACACAIGSRDRSVSVWVTSLNRPIVVLEDLFSSPVNDLSWGPRGLSFMACSNDGTTAYLEFTEQEIGTPITETDKCLLFEKLYGKVHIGNTDGGIVVVENPEALPNNTSATTTPTKQQQPPVSNNVNNTSPVVMNNNNNNMSGNNNSTTTNKSSSCSSGTGAQQQQHLAPTNKQIETRRADGRRRITPIYIPPAPDTGEEVVPFGSDSMSFSSMCSTNKSHIVVEKRDQLPTTISTSTKGTVQQQAASTTPAAVTPSGTNCLSNNIPPASTTASAAVLPTSKQSSASAINSTSNVQIKPPPSPGGDGGFTSLVTATEKSEGKRKRGAPSLQGRRTSKKHHSASAPGGGASEAQPGVAGSAADLASVAAAHPALAASAVAAATPLRLQHSVLPPMSLLQSNSIKVSGTRSILRVENNMSRSPYGNLSCVSSHHSADDTKPNWEIMLGSEVCGCVGTSDAVAIACCDRTLHLVNQKGGERLLPPVALSSAPALLSMRPTTTADRGSHLVVVTCDGRFDVWFISSSSSSSSSLTSSCRLESVISDASIAPLITASNHDGVLDMKIKDCLVSDNGEPMLALSSGKAYIYSIKLHTWLLVGNSGDPVVRNVFQSFKNTLRNSVLMSSPTAPTLLPLKALQAAAFNGVNLGGGRVLNSSSGGDTGAVCTLSYLDTQLSSSRALHSPAEYRFWLMALVRFLLQQGMETRLRRICEELLGPTHSGSIKQSWEKEILGLKKHALLQDVLGEMSTNLKSQRLYMEFKEQLDNSSHQ